MCQTETEAEKLHSKARQMTAYILKEHGVVSKVDMHRLSDEVGALLYEALKAGAMEEYGISHKRLDKFVGGILNKMKRIIVIGCPGAGKSTFARKLSVKTGFPLYYLDMIWHLPDRTTLGREAFAKSLEQIVAEDEWIIDGNYLHTMPFRLKYCDTVFFFDLPPDVCLAGAEERIGKKREDMPWVEDRLDDEFRQWIVDFPTQQQPVINSLLSEYNQKVRIIVFHTREEADAFINSITQ